MNNRLLRPTTGFSPLNIPGLEAWFDASDLSSMAQSSDGTTAVSATNDPVGYWRDKSGNGRHARQGISNNNRPLVQIADKNDRAGLDFDGTNDFMVCDAGAQYDITYYIAVMRRTGTPSSWAAVATINTLTNVAGVLASARGVPLQQAQFGTGLLFGLIGAGASGGVVRANGTALTAVNSGFFNTWVAPVVPNTTDTVVVVMESAKPAAVGTHYLCISLDPFAATRVYPMRLYELLVYSTPPSLSQIQSLERYLGNKWGIEIA